MDVLPNEEEQMIIYYIDVNKHIIFNQLLSL